MKTITPEPIPLSKKLAFSAITVVFVICFVIILEMMVRYFSPPTHPLVNEVVYDQIEWYQINRAYLKNYFTTDDALIPEFKPSLFRKTKAKNSIRIFCLGESSMFGVPYQMTANIPAILRRQLRALLPDKEIEVINLGASAINTNVILHFAPRLIQFEPDLILIYTGHNEFYGPDGVHASWLEQRFSWLTQIKYDVRETALYHILSSLGNEQQRSGPSDINLMQQVSKRAQIDLDAPEAETVLRNFESNVKNIFAVFSEKNIPVIISDITSNISFPPFIADTSFQLQTMLAKKLLDERKYSDAREYLNSLNIRTHHALVHYYLGKGYEGMGEFDSARFHYRQARDQDLLKFRAPDTINAIIKRVSKERGIPFFSVDSIFEVNSSHGIPDTTLFWEHLHPTIKGYYLIADGFLTEMEKNGLITLPDPARRVPLQYDSLHICWFDLAFGEKTIRSLTSKWPFINYSVSIPHYDNASPELKATVDQVSSFEKVWDEGCYETAQMFWRGGRLNDAITTYRAIIEEYPYNFYAQYLLGSALSQRQEYDEATQHFEIAIRSNPAYPFPMVDLGLLMVNRGQFDRSIALLTQALPFTKEERMIPLQSTIYYGLATAYANKKNYREAMVNVDRSLQAMPSNNDAVILKQKIMQLIR